MRFWKKAASAAKHMALGRLARDRRGNTLAIIAVALVPMTAMIGSGLDMARLYTVQTRLQQACDAAALAGRRAMINNAIDASVTAEATKFFDFNFRPGLYQTTPVVRTITRPAAGTVRISASTRMDTMIMKLFGFMTLPAAVSCNASQDFQNIDIVLVLDTTGSMNQTLSGGGTKIQALRDAVMSFYDQLRPTQDTLEANGYRVRYSIVPYSQNVNVGRLIRAASANYLDTDGPYSRITGAAQNGNDFNVWWQMQSVPHDATWLNNSWNGCIEERRTVASTVATPTEGEYARMLDHDIDAIPTSDSTTQWIPAAVDPVVVDSFGSDAAACPTAARRLQRWLRPDLLSYVNSLQPVGATYLDIGMIWGARMISANGIFADSPLNFNGMRTFKFVIFLSDGDMEPNASIYSSYGMEVLQRRIVGGTPSSPVNRVLNTANGLRNDLTARHNRRFARLCQSVRNMPASVWTIKLSNDPMDNFLRDCANPGQSATVASRPALIARFAEIGQAITQLRLSQ